MKLAIGCDHAGFEFKERVKKILTGFGHEVTDVGAHGKDSVDYPDFALKVAEAVGGGEVDRGVLVCWTGNGMNIAANKMAGVRAGMALNPEMAYLTRLHNDANVLTLAQKFTPEEQLDSILDQFLNTEFEGGRHERRVNKIVSVEERSSASG